MAVRCNLRIKGEIIEIIVDSGAATNIITNKLRRRLGIKINEPSKAIFTLANGKRTTSLGKTEVIVELEENIRIPIKVQVIESQDEDLILGTELFVKMKGKIEFKRKVIIPVRVPLSGEKSCL